MNVDVGFHRPGLIHRTSGVFRVLSGFCLLRDADLRQIYPLLVEPRPQPRTTGLLTHGWNCLTDTTLAEPLVPGEPLMALQFLGADDRVGVGVSEMMVVFVPGQLFGLLLVLFRFSVLVVLHRLQDVVLLHGDAFDALNLGPVKKHRQAGGDGDQTAECNKNARAPRRAGEAAPVPHPHAQADLERGVGHVHVHDEVDLPGLGRRGPDPRQRRLGHGRHGKRDGRVFFPLEDLFFRVGRCGFR